MCVCVCVIVNSCSSYEVISHMVSVYFASNGNCSLPKNAPPLPPRASQLPPLARLFLLFIFSSLISSLLLFHPPLALILLPRRPPLTFPSSSSLLHCSHSSFNLPHPPLSHHFFQSLRGSFPLSLHFLPSLPLPSFSMLSFLLPL